MSTTIITANNNDTVAATPTPNGKPAQPPASDVGGEHPSEFLRWSRDRKRVRDKARNRGGKGCSKKKSSKKYENASFVSNRQLSSVYTTRDGDLILNRPKEVGSLSKECKLGPNSRLNLTQSCTPKSALRKRAPRTPWSKVAVTKVLGMNSRAAMTTYHSLLRHQSAGGMSDNAKSISILRNVMQSMFKGLDYAQCSDEEKVKISEAASHCHVCFGDYAPVLPVSGSSSATSSLACSATASCSTSPTASNAASDSFSESSWVQVDNEYTMVDSVSMVHSVSGHTSPSSHASENNSESELKDEDYATPVVMKTCGHAVACRDCFGQYVSSRIESNDIMPWIPCPAENCRAPVHPENLLTDTSVTMNQLLQLSAYVLGKNLIRVDDWTSCANTKCKSGYLQSMFTNTSRRHSDVVKYSCVTCGTSQKVTSSTRQVLDDGFAALIESGFMRDCPKCHHYTTKDFGMCNVMQCAACQIWWNWESKDYGDTMAAVKNRARANGSLWQPGELQYQLNLEARDPQAFRALLARNGIKYDPNFARGQN